MDLSVEGGPAPLPREHGGWAMLITPPVVAAVAAGPDLLGLLATAGWICAYCLRGPVEVLRGTGASGRAGMARAVPQVARLWLLIFGGLATALLGPVVILRPQALLLLAAAAILLGLVQLLANRGLTRSVPAGLLAVAGLMLGGPLYYAARDGLVPAEGWSVALACGAFFGGSVFRVKTLARERRSGGFRWVSAAVNLGLAAGALLLAATGHTGRLTAAALVPPAAWAAYGSLRAGNPLSLGTIGKGEIVLTILFALILMAGLRMQA